MKNYEVYYLENTRCRKPLEFTTRAADEDGALRVCENEVGALYPNYVILNVKVDGEFIY